MRASWIFSKNDVIANLGILIAAGFVLLFNSSVPDLVAGFIIAVLVVRGGLEILKQSRAEKESLKMSLDNQSCCSSSSCDQ